MNKWWLIIITLIALSLRLAYINYPPLLWDEASIGYNAYSLIHTARDEYGQLLPLIFKSFGDYKPGLYIYLATPFIALFGLNTLALRLPSIILGSLLPLLLYLVVKKLSPHHKLLPLFCAILLAFNPWNIHFSRGAWETNVMLFELLLGTYLFISKKFTFASIILALSFYTYQGGKLFAPLLLLILVFSFYQTLDKKKYLQLILPFVIISLPLIYGLITQNDSNRLNVFALWNYHRPAADSQQITIESSNLNYSVFHHELIFFTRNFLTRYFNYFSFRFLTFEGDWQITRHSAPYIGVLLYPSIFFFFLGLVRTQLQKYSKLDIIFSLWLLTAPLLGALTRDIIQPVRTLPLSIPLIYFTAVGIIFALEKIPRKFIFYFNFFLLTLYSLSLVTYLELYYQHMVKVNPSHWLFGYQSAIQYVIANQTGKTVTFTDFYGQPYIYYLYYSQYPPLKYQSQAKLISSGIDTGRITQIDNLKFEVPNFNSQKNLPHQLLILSHDDALRQGIDMKVLTPLSPINGYSTFYAYQTN
ncbi:MAG: hypothetical protein WAV41_04790 [Microgenomates group bacterium]